MLFSRIWESGSIKQRFGVIIVAMGAITAITLLTVDRRYTRRPTGVVPLDPMVVSVDPTTSTPPRRQRTVPRHTHRNTANATSRKTSPSSRRQSHELNKQRLALMDAKCRHYPEIPMAATRFTMKADQRYNYMFCFIPKVACTSWLKTLARAAGKKNPQNEFVHTKRMNKYVPPISAYTHDQQHDILHNHFKFVFVRHPFERLLSAYLDKMDENRHQSPSYGLYRRIANKIKARYRRPLHPGPVTFDEFARYLLDPGAQEVPMDRHWRPYYQLCQPCRFHYNFIGHFETLAEDANYVMRRLGFPKGLEFEDNRQHRNSSNNVTEYFAGVPSQRIHRLYRRYRPDFELFGYKWPL